MFTFHILGSISLFAVFLVSSLSLLCACCLPWLVRIYPARFAIAPWLKYLKLGVYSQILWLLIAFCLLIFAFLLDDFSLAYVALHGNRQLPWLFKIGAVWGGHEGSMLLWLLLFSGWASAAVFLLSRQDQQAIGALAFMRFFFWINLIQWCFISFSLFLSNPFIQLVPAASEGMDLNPLLQDLLLMIHPPVLYTGYVGSGLVLAFVMVALSEPQRTSVWLGLLRPWVNWIWAFLTVGIVLGSYWAYYELGWGGWWFWDPVENVSLVPWLLLAALLHALHVYTRTGAMQVWTVVLGFFVFITAFFGTFLVRSGLLVSVHSFASDPERGLFLLVIMAVFVAMFLFALFRYKPVSRAVVFELLSRPVFLLLGNLVLLLAAFVLVLGILYPVFVVDVAVGAPYYYLVFLPLMFFLLLLISLGVSLSWKLTGLKQFLLHNLVSLSLSACIAAWLIYFTFPFWHWLVYGVALLGLWLLINHLILLYRALFIETGISNLRVWSACIMLMAHGGLGLLVFSGVVNTVYQQELSQPLALQESMHSGSYFFRFDDLIYDKQHNYVLVRAKFAVYKQHQLLTYLYPEKRLYVVRQNILSETAILPSIGGDWLITLGEELKGTEKGLVAKERWMVRVQYQPWVRLIWLGALLIACAAVLGVFRKYLLTRLNHETT